MIKMTRDSMKAWNKAMEQKVNGLEESGSRAVEDTANKVESEVSKRIAKESTNKGQYLQSVYNNKKGLKAEVGATAAHAPYVEFGTRPHRPPFQPIYEWVWLKRHDLDLEDEDAVYAFTVYLVNKIAQYGTEENLQWTETIKENKQYFEKRIREALDEVI